MSAEIFAICVNTVGDDILKYSALLRDSMEKEKAGIAYCCPEADKKLLADLLLEINHYQEPFTTPFESLPLQFQKNTNPLGWYFFGGDGGIRTHGPLQIN